MQSAPEFPASRPSDRKLALVWLKGVSGFVVRDVTDIDHPFTVSTLPLGGTPAFVSATDLAVDFVRMPLSGSPQTVVVKCTLAGGFLAWSPDGTQAAYLVVNVDYGVADFHLIAQSTDRRLMSFPTFPWGTDCEAPSCADRLDSRLTYSPDSRYISFIQNWGGPVLRIWKGDGTLVKSIDVQQRDPSGAPTMSVWSGPNLYFRDGRGVEVWHDGAQSLLLANVEWIRPRASPAGGQIVYEAKDAYGVPGVFIFDTASGATRTIARLRSEPAFLTSRYLWYQEERPCSSADQYPCGDVASTARTSTRPTGRTFIYDLQTGLEIESIIAKVWDVWPHAG